MRAKSHQLPGSGPASDPVLYGVAHGLSERFPPVEFASLRDETDERNEEAPTLSDDPQDYSGIVDEGF